MRPATPCRPTRPAGWLASVALTPVGGGRGGRHPRRHGPRPAPRADGTRRDPPPGDETAAATPHPPPTPAAPPRTGPPTASRRPRPIQRRTRGLDPTAEGPSAAAEGRAEKNGIRALPPAASRRPPPLTTSTPLSPSRDSASGGAWRRRACTAGAGRRSSGVGATSARTLSISWEIAPPLGGPRRASLRHGAPERPGRDANLPKPPPPRPHPAGGPPYAYGWAAPAAQRLACEIGGARAAPGPACGRRRRAPPTAKPRPREGVAAPTRWRGKAAGQRRGRKKSRHEHAPRKERRAPSRRRRQPQPSGRGRRPARRGARRAPGGRGGGSVWRATRHQAAVHRHVCLTAGWV